MPLFKFTDVANVGEIFLGAFIYGECVQESTGNIILTGPVSVSGQQVPTACSGSVFPSVTVAGAAGDVGGDGAITLSISVLGYSSGAGTYTASGDLTRSDFAVVSFDGVGILNGVGEGAVIIRPAFAYGRQGPRGEIVLGLSVRGFGASRVGAGSAVLMPVYASGTMLVEDFTERTGSLDAILWGVFAAGRGTKAATESLVVSGAIQVKGVTLLGYAAPAPAVQYDAVLRYESRRRRI